MARFKTPCTRCGEPTRQTQCNECQPVSDRQRVRTDQQVKTSPAARGYDSRWRRLSERARKIQPFCTDCGSTTDLQADHSPEAWERYKRGLPLRVIDVEVTCGRCNRARGAARGSHVRSANK